MKNIKSICNFLFFLFICAMMSILECVLLEYNEWFIKDMTVDVFHKSPIRVKNSCETNPLPLMYTSLEQRFRV